MKTLAIFFVIFCGYIIEPGERENLADLALDRKYAHIDVYNNAGINTHDFVFSYDVINGFGSCRNNFAVKSNVNFTTNISFRIYFSGELIYSGQTIISPRGRFYLNNAFFHCNVLNSTIRIIID
ncbi:hypothetical protein SAMN05444483_101395 [Salegentibacter echinorum]|uniref:Uncharacterized protein n=1 Tax=Salegentibacter echinorum TaxID=1073325 RepID=A0A1M5C8H6_SALEC|nr:hypothetical protein [Salegentibacter echinorum]SHF51048.1 hypothetical protein SAMN05444483_101395 [Salegentibacter echinorum]